MKDKRLLDCTKLWRFRNSQSALEYIATYSWAIFIIVLVAAALYFMGVFTLLSPAPAHVSGFSGFTITTFECIQNIGMLLQLTNQIGYSVAVTNISFQPSGKTVWEAVNFQMTPGASETVLIIGACPSSTGPFTMPGFISYTELGSIFTTPAIASGSVYGTQETSVSNFLDGQYGYMLSTTYAFGTPYIGVPYKVQEFYANGIYLGRVASQFPAALNDLNNGVPDCSAPYDSQGYTAVADKYIPGVASFSTLTNDGTAIFYRNASGGGPWQAVMANSTTWAGHSSSTYGPFVINVTPGEYEIAVDWTNICIGGVSAISLGGPVSFLDGEINSEGSWNVTAWTPMNLNKSVDLLPLQYVEADPALPLNVSAEQWGTWSQGFSANSCNSNDLCTAIFDAFSMPTNTTWWVDYGGVNDSSSSSFITFAFSHANYSFEAAAPKVVSGGCVDSYTASSSSSSSYSVKGSSPGWAIAGSSVPIFFREAENCSTAFEETGLPSGDWNMTFNGVKKTVPVSDNITFYSRPGAFSFTPYAIKIGSATYYPCPPSGEAASGSTVNLTYSASSSCNQAASAFSESGLPYGLNWTVKYNGVNHTTNSSAVSFQSATGSHAYKAFNSSVTFLFSGCTTTYYPGTPSGSLGAGGSQSVSFSSTENCTSRFFESGLPAGAQWNATYSGKTASSSANTLSFYRNQSDAAFIAYNITYGGTRYYPCPNKGVLPGGMTQDINFSTSFVPSCRVG